MKSGLSQAVTWTASSFDAGTGRSITLPNSVTISTPPAVGVRYLAPHGNAEFPGDEAGFVWTLESASGKRMEVAAIGVLGKAVLRFD